MKKLIILTILLCIFPSLNCGKEKTYYDISIKGKLRETSWSTKIAQEDYGFLIYDPEHFELVSAHNLINPFIPASVSKLFTAVLALEVLKPDYTFSTDILYTGTIADGVLNGDLILRGSGDPELSIQDLTEMILELKTRGIVQVRGRFYYDIDSFESKESLDPAMPVNARYNPGFGPLNLNRNLIYAIKRIEPNGKLKTVDLLPSIPANRAYLYNGPDVLLYAKYSNENGIETWGLPSSGTWENRLQLPVKNTAQFTSSAFKKLSEMHGITIPEPERGKNNYNAKSLIIHKSRKLSLILNDMLINSDNLTAEIIGTVVSVNLNLKIKMTPEEFLKHKFPSINWNNFRLEKYSGLTDMNRATPEQTAAMLLYLDRQEDPDLAIPRLLPMSGLEGTMKSKLDRPETAFRVFAKTGSIYYASALAGEFFSGSGKRYIFVIFIDDKKKRNLYSLSESRSIDEAKTAEKWSSDSAKVIEDFIYKQISSL